MVKQSSTLGLLIVALFASTSTLAKDGPTERKTREIFVPFEDLDVLLEGQNQRVLLTREEYEELREKAKQVAPDAQSPFPRVLLSAQYEGRIESGRTVIQATLTFESLSADLIAVPLEFSGVMLRAAKLDGGPALLGKGADEKTVLFLKGQGKHELQLELIAPLLTSAAEQSMAFQLPIAAATRWHWTVPGNVEVKQGIQVIRREVDEKTNVTRLEFLPQREPARIVMSLNNRILLQQRVVLARSVLIDELTEAYEKLHATVSLGIPHGAVDRFRFALPAGFEVTDVNVPQLARWAVESQDTGKVLDVVLREAVRDSVVLQIVAVNHSPNVGQWSMPKLRPLEVNSHAAVVGVLAEDRLKATTISPSGLIAVDASVLNAAIPPSVLQAEPGAPRLRSVAAFYAPQADFGLDAAFQRDEAKLEVTTNLLFTTSDRGVQMRGGFALRPLVERLFAVEIHVPAGWDVSKVSSNDGTVLPFQLYPEANGQQRLNIKLPGGLAPKVFSNLFVEARHVPTGWLAEWNEQALPLPSFAVDGADRDIGAVAVRTEDDLIARPAELNGLTPLDEKEKKDFGLEGTPTGLAYRYEKQPYAMTLRVERPQPRLTARTLSFFRLEPDGMFAHYELIYQVDSARARRLQFRLPLSTPQALAIRGLDVPVKEYQSQDLEGERQWTVELAEPRSGTVRLAVDFQAPIPNLPVSNDQSQASNKVEVDLPIVQAANVVYQSGAFAVEANMEFDVEIRTDARKVDIGELVDAEYQVGNRVLGAFGFVGTAGSVKAAVQRRPAFGLPSAIVQRAELVTALARHGVSQTAARFHLRTKAPFLVIGLPTDAILWSATIDGQPVAPQRDRDQLLLSLDSTKGNETRDLQLIYELPIRGWSGWGEIHLNAPRLLLRDETGATQAEVPLADLQWHLILPDGQRILRSSGNVFGELVPTASPVRVVLSTSAELFGAIGARAGATVMLPMREHGARDMAPAATKAIPLGEQKAGDAEFAPPAPLAASPAEPEAQPESQSGTPEALRWRVKAQPTPSARPAEGRPGMGIDNRPSAADNIANPASQPAAQQSQSQSGARQFWALEGVKSLPVELARSGREVTFQSLGVNPRLQVTMTRERSVTFLAAALAIIIGVLGLLKSDDPVSRQARFVLLSGVILLAIPLVLGIVFHLELTAVFAPAFYVVCGLAVWYLLIGLLRFLGTGFARILRRRRAAATTAAVIALCWASTANAQDAATIETLRGLLTSPPPVKAPEDAVVIPFDSDDPLGPQKATKVFIPYSEYARLWNRVHPNQPLASKPGLAKYALGAAVFTATLGEDETLQVTGKLDIEVFEEGDHLLPLPILNAVLTRVTIGGQPARMHILQPQLPAAAVQTPATQNAAPASAAPAPQPVPAVLLNGIGRKSLEFELRFKIARSGGWRIALGRLPAWPAAAFDLVVPKAKTEVQFGHGSDDKERSEFETEKDSETIKTAVSPDGQFHLQWRSKQTEGQVDQSLTARSTAVLDLQEDALRLTWQTELSFRGGQRESFTFVVPADLLLEKVLGGNVRGWKSTPDGDKVKVDVTLLKASTERESLTLLLSKRAALGEGAMAGFVAPYVTVTDAAQHQGLIVIRRSPMLQVRVEDSTGLDRDDADQERISNVLAHVSDESPLGIRVFQAYRFAATPFTLRFSAKPFQAVTSAVVQSLLKIADRENHFEARVVFKVENRPRFSAQFRLPNGLTVDDVTSDAKIDWTITTEGETQTLNVFLPNGQQQFSIVIQGRMPRTVGDSFAAPMLQVLNVDSQTGQLVVQADPAYDIRATNVQNGQTILMQQVFGWLNPEQRRLARVAFSYSNPDFSASLQVVPRQARVRAFSITNSRVTQYAVEDTVYLHFTIRDAGIRSVAFQLPASMRDARVTAPLLRQKTIEPMANNAGRLRFQLELQDEVTDQFIVVVEHDRELTADTIEAPIPVIETGVTENRFVVLENAGRDEMEVTSAEQLSELNRQQSQWAKLAEVLGDKILRAYVVRENATQPRFVIQTKRRARVETVEARIGLAKTLLVVDSYGAYRGLQEYFVDNKTEQYLEVELPEGAELWTVQVAGEPVKPVKLAGSGPRQVFVPLIKSAAGDLDYPVQLKYGGRIAMPKRLGKVTFPLMHTKNIRVELSQVRLRLPDSRKWVDFGGTMRHVEDEGEMAAGFVSYQSRQLQKLMGVLQDGEAFSKVRAAGNLKRLSSQNSTQSLSTYFDNTELQRELSNNASLQQQANQVLEEETREMQQTADADNRFLLLLRCESQPLNRSKNVVTQLNSNFDVSGGQPAKEAAQEQSESVQRFNAKWFEGNKLQQPADEKSNETRDSRRSRLGDDVDMKKEPAVRSKSESSRVANELGKKVTEDLIQSEVNAKETIRARGPERAEGLNRQVERYQLKLEQKQLQTFDAPSSAFSDQSTVTASPQQSGMGGGNLGGFATDGATLFEQNVPSSPQNYAATGLASLDVNIPERGIEHRFVTPRGEIEIEAWMVHRDDARRFLPLAVMLVGAIAVVWATKRR